MSAALSSPPSLASLLPTRPYLIAYSVPILLISLVLTFAGAFLTLDRTRKFRPRYDALPGSYPLKGDLESFGRIKVVLDWFAKLEGGLGGLTLGYAFGVHLSTLLSLLIPASSSASPLSSISFIPTYLLSGLFTLMLAGRYSVLALLFSSVSGAFTFALGLSIIIHPSLWTRVVLISVLMSLLTLAVAFCSFVPALSRFKHPLVRFSASSVGAFGVTMSISLLSSGVSSWSSPYSHLYLTTSPVAATPSLEWGTSAEKGFSALFCVLLLLGTVCDWALWKKFGECPDEKWDNYLAQYAANLPNDKNRAGTFQPFGSMWDRLFGHGEVVGTEANSRRNEAVFPLSEMEMTTDPDVDIKHPQYALSLSRTGYLNKLRRYDSNFSPTSTLTIVNDEPLPMYKPAPGLLKKGGRRSTGGKSVSSAASPRGNGFQRKEAVKFRPHDTNDFSDSDDDDLDYEKEMGKLKAMRRRTKDNARPLTPGSSDREGDGPPDYSDFESDVDKGKPGSKEQDITSSLPSSQTSSNTEEWTPGFLKKHRTSQSRSSSQSQSVPPLPAQKSAAPVSVPASPSLIVALDRVEKARREAYSQSHPHLGHPGTDAVTGVTATQGETEGVREEGRGQRWEEFWQEVQVKDQYQGPETAGVGRR